MQEKLKHGPPPKSKNFESEIKVPTIVVENVDVKIVEMFYTIYPLTQEIK
jgi:hypothetical protein